MVEKRRGILETVITIILCVAIIILLVIVIKNTPNLDVFYGDIYDKNLQSMKDVADDYFTIDKLPKETGQTVQLSLQDMLNNKFITDFVDRNGKTCDTQNSYANVTKLINGELVMKVQLVCDGESDYILKTIGCKDVCKLDSYSKDLNKEKESSSTSTGSKSTSSASKSTGSSSTKSSGTTTVINNTTIINNNYTNNYTPKPIEKPEPINYVYVIFNSDGGSYVPSQKIKQGDKAVVPTPPIRDGYKFIGWYYNGVLFDFNTVINNTITLIAKWEKINPEIISYKFVGQKKVYSNWTSGRCSGIANCEEQYVSTIYYCPTVTKTYYSVTYGSVVGASANWTIQFLDIPANASNVTITGPYGFTTTDYNNYNDNTSRNNVQQKGSTGANDAYVPSGMVLYNSSIKPGNYTAYFTNTIKYVYPYWEVSAYMRINSTYDASLYGGKYFVPFKYNISYTDNNNCSYNFVYQYRTWSYVDDWTNTICRNSTSNIDGYRYTGSRC